MKALEWVAGEAGLEAETQAEPRGEAGKRRQRVQETSP